MWTVIEALQADAAEASATVLRHSVGNLQPTKRSRAATAHQQRLRRLYDDYDAGRRDMAGFMQAIGDCIQLVCK